MGGKNRLPKDKVAVRAGRRSKVAPCSTWCYASLMTSQPEITQRDLRLRSREIMDAVESGQTFTVTRDGRSIGELVPLRQRRRFVSRSRVRGFVAERVGR